MKRTFLPKCVVILNAHPLFLCSFYKCGDPLDTIRVFVANRPHPGPAKVLDKLCQGSALVEIAGNSSEERWKLLSVAQTSTGCKVTEL